MRKWIWLGAILLFLLPERGTDVGKLLPVETLLIEKEAERYVVSTDTGNSARGDTLEAAMDALRASAPGVIFLDTADYVLLTGETLECVEELSGFVRPGTQIYTVAGSPDLGKIGGFLEAHGPDAPLYQVQKGEKKAPKLCIEGENWHFEGK